MSFRDRLPPTVDRKAVSEESRPAVIRSIESRGASPVGSMTCQAPLICASATAWKD